MKDRERPTALTRRRRLPLTDIGKNGRRVPVRARDDKPLREFYDQVDLPSFKRALEFSQDPRYTMLHAALSSPSFDMCTFPELCRRCRLTLRDVTNLWKDYTVNLGTVLMANHLPQIMEGIAKDALSKEYECPECEGTGRNKGMKHKGQVVAVCRACRGSGRVTESGDKDARQQVLEVVGLKRSGPIMVQNVQVGEVPTLENTMDELEGAINITPTGVQEAEIVHDSEVEGNREGAPPAEPEPGPAAQLPDAPAN